MGIISLLDNLLKKLPIQDRKERIKNHIEDLRNERAKLLKEISSVKTSKRISAIDQNILKSEQLLRNLT